MPIFDRLLKTIDRYSKEGSFENLNATSLSNELNLKRNTVSHYLNKLFNENKLIKINSRPVIFISKKYFLTQGGSEKLSEFKNTKELYDELSNHADPFSEVIGCRLSLYQAIEQLKAAASYPQNGLATILTGPTGSGKSFLAKKFYLYCKEKGFIEKNAPFVSFNCAQYADNPELLTSSLFGYKEGAFTGANKDTVGIFEKANGGILFLDEVQRLSKHGQEKLFTYLDKGIIYRIGEDSIPRKVTVRLLFATTESLKDFFLDTFLRRVPVQIKIPGINERTKEERNELIYYFLKDESINIGKSILVNKEFITQLSNDSYYSNVGGIKIKIKRIVATALVHETDQSHINLALYNGPDGKSQLITIDKNTDIKKLIGSQKEKNHIQETIEKILKKYPSETNNLHDFLNYCISAINDLNDYLFFFHAKSGSPINYYMKYIKRIIHFYEINYNIHFNNNADITISYYMLLNHYDAPKLNETQNQTIKKINRLFEQNLGISKETINSFFQTLSDQLNLSINYIDKMYILMCLLNNRSNKTNFSTRGLILTHGYATASSISNVVNRLLKRNIFGAIDMPVTTTTQQLGDKLQRYFTESSHKYDTLVFVDMGSLPTILKKLEQKFGFTIGLIDNVSTGIVLDSGQKILEGYSVEKIVSTIPSTSTPKGKMLYPVVKKQNLIITTCLTGIGTAKQIRELLINSLPKNLDDIISVKSYELSVLQDKKQSDIIRKSSNILLVTGTYNPKLKNTEFISLEDLISNKGINILKNVLKNYVNDSSITELNNNIIRNFSLKRIVSQVSILDSVQAIKHIDEFIKKFENQSNIIISNKTRIGLYIHTVSLIERLIRDDPIKAGPKMSHIDWNIMNTLRSSFTEVETTYQIKIPLPELKYVYQIIEKNGDLSK